MITTSTDKEILLNTFKSEIEKVLPLPKNEKTFLQILKVSNKEVPIANLLAYFFKPNESHNLGDLFIRSLFQTGCYTLKECSELNALNLNGYLHNGELLVANPGFSSESFIPTGVKVHTEKKTGTQKAGSQKTIDEKKEDQKRIDIVIEADQFIIAIEFKINHVLDNPLDIYKEFIVKEYCKDKVKPLFFVILTPALRPHQNPANKNEDFKQITLSSFINQVKVNLPEEVNNKIAAKDYSVFYLMDLIRTVDNRKRNQEFIAKLINNLQILDLYDKLSANALLNEFKAIEDAQACKAVLFLKDLDEKIAKKLKALQKELLALNDFNHHAILAKNKPFEGYIMIKIPGTNQAVKVRLSIKGWMLELWQATTGEGYPLRISEPAEKHIDFATGNYSMLMKINQYLNRKERY